eukprot:gene4330-6131_t
MIGLLIYVLLTNQIFVTGASNHNQVNIVGFYQIFTSFNIHEHIVEDQIKYIKRTGVYDLLSSVSYTVVGNHDYFINDTKFIHSEYAMSGHEDLTLIRLYRYCRSNPSDITLYFHPKGSFSEETTKRAKNLLFRSMLDYYVLHTQCYGALMNNGFDICGARLSPLPHIHYSGNYWWAKCSFVNTLIDPSLMVVGSELQNVSAEYFRGIPPSILGLDRFFAETWIGSGPKFRAADCIPETIGYLNGYNLPKVLQAELERSSQCMDCYKQIICQTAAVDRLNVHPMLKYEYWEKYRIFYNYNCAGQIEQMLDRGRLWYNTTQHPSILSMRAHFGDYLGKSNKIRNIENGEPSICKNIAWHLNDSIKSLTGN